MASSAIEIDAAEINERDKKFAASSPPAGRVPKMSAFVHPPVTQRLSIRDPWQDRV